MAKTLTKKRYLASPAELEDGRPPVDYHDQWRVHRYDPTQPEPPSEEIQVVETVAIQGGKKTKIRVAKADVPAYERIVTAFDREKRGAK